MIIVNESRLSIGVLMPTGRLFDRIFAEGIAPVCRELGSEAKRVEAQFSGSDKLSGVHDRIRQSDVIVADISARNPNVLYEVGFAHALGKRVILLSQAGEDLPFDQHGHPVIIYADNVEFLKNQLREKLQPKAKTEGVQEVPSSTGTNVSNARRRFMDTFGDILQEHGYTHEGEVQLEGDKTFVLLNQEMDLALVQDLARRARSRRLRLKLL